MSFAPGDIAPLVGNGHLIPWCHPLASRCVSSRKRCLQWDPHHQQLNGQKSPGLQTAIDGNLNGHTCQDTEYECCESGRACSKCTEHWKCVNRRLPCCRGMVARLSSSRSFCVTEAAKTDDGHNTNAKTKSTEFECKMIHQPSSCCRISFAKDGD